MPKDGKRRYRNNFGHIHNAEVDTFAVPFRRFQMC